jgi:hypothetical protein
MTVKQVVNVFTTKTEFTSIYPSFFTNEQFATKLVTNVVGDSATAAAKTAAADDIAAALNAGWSRGDVIYQVFTNLAAKSATDATWGATSTLMANQVKYAQYYTEELLGDTTSLTTLKAVISGVTATSSTTDAAINAALVPVAPAATTYTATLTGTTVTEGESSTTTVAVIVTLDTPAASSFNINYVTASDTATSGSDFVAATGVISFVAGQSSALISLSVLGDNTAESTEAFTVTVSGTSLKASAAATITITDNDSAPVINTTAISNIAEGVTAITTISASDADDTTLSYSLSGTDVASFAISTSGVLTLITASDYETKTSYSVTVAVSDGTNTTTKAFTVGVTDSIEATALTVGADNAATGSGSDNITATELTLSVQDTLAGGTGNDSLTLTVGADASADNLTFIMSGIETLVLATGGDTATQASDTMSLTMDLTDVTDLTLINDTRSASSTNSAGALTVNGLSSTTDLTLGGDATSVTVGLKSDGFTGTADDMTINAKAFAGTLAFTNIKLYR